MFPVNNKQSPYDNIKETASQEFNFRGPEDELTPDEKSELFGDVHIMLDPDEYIDEETGKTSYPSIFEFGETVHLLVIVPDFSKSFDVLSNVGTITQKKAGHRYHYADQVVFDYSKSGSLRYIPQSNPTWRWLGNQPGLPSPAFDGKAVAIATNQIETLLVEYDISCEKWDVTLTEGEALAYVGTSGSWNTFLDAVAVAVVALQGDKKDSVKINYNSEENITGEPSEPTEWRVFLVHACENTPMPAGINVSTAGVVGQTDENGSLFIGLQNPGQFNFSASKSGVIIATEDDLIDNDRYTLP